MHVRSLSAGLVARGLRVTVCGPWSAERGYGFARTGARFTGLDALTGAGSMASLRRATHGAALVHAHGLRSGLLAAVALRGRNVPLIVTWHTRVDAEGARARLVGLMERRVARAAAIVLGASSDLVERARASGARDARLAPVAVPAPRRAPEPGDGRRQKARAELGVVERPLLVTAGLAWRRWPDTARCWTRRGAGAGWIRSRCWRWRGRGRTVRCCSAGSIWRGCRCGCSAGVRMCRGCSPRPM